MPWTKACDRHMVLLKFRIYHTRGSGNMLLHGAAEQGEIEKVYLGRMIPLPST